MFLFLIFFSITEHYLHKYRIYIYFVIGIILILLTTFRFEGSTKDYFGYIEILKGENEFENYRIEPTFKLFKFVINNYFNENKYVLFFIYALLGICLKFNGILRYSIFPLFSILVYYSGFFLLHEMTQIRAGVAAGFLFLLIEPLLKRDLIKFLLIIFIASLFHYSALAFIFLWLINNNSKSLKYFGLLIPLALLFYYFKFDIFFIFQYFPQNEAKDKFDVYQNVKDTGILSEVNLFNLLTIFRIFLAYFLLHNHNILISKCNAVSIFLKIYFLAIFFQILLIDISAVSGRISELFFVVEIILLPTIILLFKETKIIKTSLILLCTILLLYNIFIQELVS